LITEGQDNTMHINTAQAIASALGQAQRIVIFTGAGMSAESGIATFRGLASSHWQQFNPQELASPDGWQANKQRVWAWYEGRRAQVIDAQPHAGHLAIAQLAERLQHLHGRVVQVDVVTQNVDNLHERAGSPTVTHLHGSLFAPHCDTCHRPGDFVPGQPDASLTTLEPPRCTHCDGYIRPGVVWFGEAMPTAPWREVEDLVDACDAMLVVGTSGVVWPAAELPISAHNRGKFVAEINPEPSGLAHYMRHQWPTSAAQGLPQLLDLIQSSPFFYHPSSNT
jgi:NAD-dependent deacetylase